MAEPEPVFYGIFGETMKRIASKRGIRGPYKVSAYIRAKTGGGPKGPSWSDYYYGKSDPTAETMERIAKAFELTVEEKKELAYVHAYREPYPKKNDGQGDLA